MYGSKSFRTPWIIHWLEVPIPGMSLGSHVLLLFEQFGEEFLALLDIWVQVGHFWVIQGRAESVALLFDVRI